MMNPKELKQKTDNELEKLAQDLRAESRDLRFKIATRQNAKVRNLRRVKKDLARVLTTLQAKRTHETKV
ncbi:MAG: 50S ribosomal protein L29 [bacterium]|nr:50S ribosomal protein L29 [bacterium]